MNELINHLWQSTLFAGIVAVVAWSLKDTTARLRYQLWLAASMKFLVPFAFLVSLGSNVELERMPPVTTAAAVVQLTQTFSPIPTTIPTQADAFNWSYALFAAWICGVLFVLCRWVIAWRIVYLVRKTSTAIASNAPIEIRSSTSSIEPGVFGLFKPVLLLPEGIANALSKEQLDAVIAHEIAHVRHRDNLTAALHMFVETLFWFHPLVWWLGGKLMEERERACDEAVLAEGNSAQTYAEGILNVCRYYVVSPVACSAGVTGADLRTRIEEIMNFRMIRQLGAMRRIALVATAVAIVSAPFALGLLRAQILPPAPKYRFEEASIRKNTSASGNSRIGPGPQGGLRTENTSAMQFLTFAYDVRDYQIVGAPEWVKSDRYDLTGIPETPEEAPSPTMGRAKLEAVFSRHKQRMQSMLAERFGLVLRAEQREMSIYGLTIGKNGHKLTEITDEKKPPHLSTNNGRMTGQGVLLSMMANSLSSLLGRPVIDETGLKSGFDFKLEWTPENRQNDDTEAAAKGSIFTALQEQLGLKLESKKGKAPVFVIEKIERPTEN